MNLTIPIMQGQMAQITIMDNKTHEQRVWMATHNRVTCMKTTGTTAQIEFDYTTVMAKENVLVKGLGRNKRRCPTNHTLEGLNGGSVAV